MEPETPTEKPTTDTRTEMIAEAEKLSQESEETQETKPEVKESEKPEEDRKPKPEDESDKDDPEAKKPNRYQRQKARAEAAEVLANKNAGERDEAVKYANVFLNRYESLVKEHKELRAKAAKAGLTFSPESDENFSLKQKERERQLYAKWEEQKALDTKKQQEEYAKNNMQEELKEQSRVYAKEAMTVVSKYMNGSSDEEMRKGAAKVLKAYAFACRAGEDMSMDEVAATLFQVTRKKSDEERQLEVNSGAPSTLRPGKSGMVFKDNRSEMLAYAKSHQ